MAIGAIIKIICNSLVGVAVVARPKGQFVHFTFAFIAIQYILQRTTTVQSRCTRKIALHIWLLCVLKVSSYACWLVPMLNLGKLQSTYTSEQWEWVRGRWRINSMPRVFPTESVHKFWHLNKQFGIAMEQNTNSCQPNKCNGAGSLHHMHHSHWLSERASNGEKNK